MWTARKEFPKHSSSVDYGLVSGPRSADALHEDRPASVPFAQHTP